MIPFDFLIYASAMGLLDEELAEDLGLAEDPEASEDEDGRALSIEQLELLIRNSAAWIRDQRKKYRQRGDVLLPYDRDALQNFFKPTTLDHVRIARVPRIQNPRFFAQLGFLPIDFSRMCSITFNDTVLVSNAYVSDVVPTPLIFHELVHVVQYKVLGVKQFAHRYVEGWAKGGFVYKKIPLEKMAYQLQAEFEQGSLGEASVETRIRDELRT